MKISITALRAVGVSAEMILAAMEMDTEDKRAKETTRKAQYRSRVSHMSRDVPYVPRDKEDKQDQQLGAEQQNNGSYKEDSLQGRVRNLRKKEPRKIKRPLPDDWDPSESLLAYGREQGLSADQTLKTIENLKIWARANGAVKADWDATLQGFFRTDATKLGCSQPRAPMLTLAAPEHGNQHAGRVYLRRETPQFEAWAAHTGKAVTDKHGGWWFDSEWPSERRMASS